MKILFSLVLFVTTFFPVMSQVIIEKTGSPDLVICNTNAPNTDIPSRMFFKTGDYYTGGLATIGTGGIGARLGFFTQSTIDQNSMLERMSILNSGNIGIGTTNPQYLFHVKFNGSGIMQESSSGQARVGFWTNTNIAYVQTHNNIPLFFATNNSPAQMALTTTGRLGIGTTTPVSKLEVKGKTTIVQQAGEDAALEIQGTLKLSGANPIAFQVVVTTSPNFIKINHPHCNGNQNALLMVTSVKKYSDDGDISCPFHVVYESDGFWYLRPGTGCDFDFQQRFNILILL